VNFPTNPVAIGDTREVLDVGLRWLYETEQRPGAMDHHHGTRSPVVAGMRIFTFTPVGYAGLPVIVYDVARPVFDDSNGMLINPLGGHDERVWLISVINDLGRKTAISWNGDGITGSIGLGEPAHPTLRAAISLYAQGCPTRKCPMRRSTLCSKHQWFTPGNAQMRYPKWPDLLDPGPRPELVDAYVAGWKVAG